MGIGGVEDQGGERLVHGLDGLLKDREEALGQSAVALLSVDGLVQSGPEPLAQGGEGLALPGLEDLDQSAQAQARGRAALRQAEKLGEGGGGLQAPPLGLADALGEVGLGLRTGEDGRGVEADQGTALIVEQMPERLVQLDELLDRAVELSERTLARRRAHRVGH